MDNRHLKPLALVLFAGYILWNIWWISRGYMPPSVFYYVSGYPCPTTGCTRSLFLLFDGELGSSFRYNPLTLVYSSLFLLTFFFLIKNYKLNGRICIPNYMGVLWGVTLILGWFAKFLIGSDYW